MSQILKTSQILKMILKLARKHDLSAKIAWKRKMTAFVALNVTCLVLRVRRCTVRSATCSFAENVKTVWTLLVNVHVVRRCFVENMDAPSCLSVVLVTDPIVVTATKLTLIVRIVAFEFATGASICIAMTLPSVSAAKFSALMIARKIFTAHCAARSIARIASSQNIADLVTKSIVLITEQNFRAIIKRPPRRNAVKRERHFVRDSSLQGYWQE